MTKKESSRSTKHGKDGKSRTSPKPVAPGAEAVKGGDQPPPKSDSDKIGKQKRGEVRSIRRRQAAERMSNRSPVTNDEEERPNEMTRNKTGAFAVEGMRSERSDYDSDDERGVDVVARPVEAYKATLPQEEEEEIRKEAEMQAQEKVFSQMPAAQAVNQAELDEINKQKSKRRRCIIGCLVCAVLVVGAIVAVVIVVVGGKAKESNDDLGPTTQPTVAPDVDEDTSSDRCEDSIPLMPEPGMIIGTTTFATVDFNIPTCEPRQLESGRGVWYKMEGNGEPLSVSTCTGTSFDTEIMVLSGLSCSRLQCINSNDQLFGCGNGDQSHVIWLAEAGVTYYIHVRGVREAFGTFELASNVVSKHNFHCTGAVTIQDFDRTTTQTVFGTTRFAPLNSDVPSCDGTTNSAPGAWFLLDAQVVGFLEARVDGFASQISIFKGSCDNLQCVTASSNGIALWTTAVATKYFIFVHGIGENVGDFALTLSPGGILKPDPNAPTNSICTAATPISVAFATVATGTTAVGEVADVESCGFGVFGGAPGVWYAVEGTGRGIMASTCETLSGFDTQVSVYAGDCESLQCVDGNDQDCGDQSTVAWHSEQGIRYYIYVHSSQGRVGDFNLTISEDAFSISDECTSAIGPLLVGSSGVLGSTDSAIPYDVGNCNDVDTTSAPSAWYSVLGTGTTLVASTCNSYLKSYAKIVVLVGGCDNLECVDANKLSCGDQMTVTWESSPDEMYYVLVYGTDLSELESSSFVLSIDESPMNNFQCNDSIETIQAGGSLVLSSVRGSLLDSGRLCSSNAGNHLGTWFKVVEPDSALWTLSTCSKFTNFETKISVFRGDGCNSIQCVASNDGTSCGAWSQVSWYGTANDVYYILVQGSSPEDFGNFALSFGVQNDICTNAVGPLRTDGSKAIGSTQYATADDLTITCAPDQMAPDAGVWYFVEGNGTILVASTCESETDFDTMIYVYQGESCDSLSCVQTNESFCDGRKSSVTWFATEGERFYILVHGIGRGAFGLSINTRSNGSCSSAFGSLPVNGDPVLGLTTTGVVVGNNDDACVASNEDSLASWFSVDGTGQFITVSTCQSPGFQSRLSILSGDCSSLDCVDVSDGDCEVTFPSVFGQEYFVLVSDLNTEGSNFSLSVTADNDRCEDAAGPLTRGARIRGSTVEALAGDMPSSCGAEINTNVGAGVWYSFIGDGDPVTAHTCSEFTNFSTQITIFSGSCNSITCMGNRSGNCAKNAWMTFMATEGQTFYILVSALTSDVGDFELFLV